MDGLSTAASLIAVIQLTGQVTCLGYSYMSKVKQAPKDIQALVDELVSLSRVLNLLQNYVNNNNPTQSDSLQILAGPLHGCALELEKLESKLKPSMNKWRRILGSLKWPLKEAEILQIIARIERHKSLFLITLNIDHISQFQANSADQISRRRAEETVRAEEKRKQVLNWLYPESFDKKHTEISSTRQKDTGKWLLESPNLQALINGKRDSKLLWGYGIPGAGKTFLSSAVVDHFQSQARTKSYGVAYFYFDYKEKNRQRPVHVLGSLVKQLVSQLVQLPTEVSELHDELENESKRPTINQLYVVLQSTFRFFSRVFFIFDALDECDQDSQRKELLPFFHRIVETGASVFITSRQYPEDIQESFQDAAKIELSAKGDDVRSYIKEKIDENPRAKRLVQQGKFRERIILELIDCAKGMFLAVRFHVEYLCQQTTAKQILMALENLKNSATKERPLDPTYDRVMESLLQQPESCASLAIRILSWLVQAKRTLTVKEIQIAVSIEPGRYELDDLDLPDRKTLLDVCFGLVGIDENSDTIRLAHLTVHEYLLRNSIIPETTNFQIAMACTTYNSFNILAEVPCERLGEEEGFWDYQLELCPFLLYSACHMSSHLKTCDERLTKDLVSQFLGRPGNVSFWVLATYFTKNYKRYWTSKEWMLPKKYSITLMFMKSWTPLEIASRIGHCLVVRQLLEGGDNVSVAARLAASEGHEEIVRLLVDNGANIFIPDSNGRSPLHLAALKGAEATVGLLLGMGADLSLKDKKGNTPFHLAAKKGHEAVVRLLLERGVDLSASNERGNTALHLAASGGYEVVVKLLLTRGTDSSAKDKWGHMALHLAANGGHEAVARALLEEGVDFSAKDEGGYTALHLAAGGGHEAVARLLLEKGIECSAKSGLGDTALHLAANGGHAAVVKLLLKRGIEFSAKNKWRYTALHFAANSGHEAVVTLLLDRGIDSSARDEWGNTALNLATSGGHKAVAQLLLGNGSTSQIPEIGGEASIDFVGSKQY